MICQVFFMKTVQNLSIALKQLSGRRRTVILMKRVTLTSSSLCLIGRERESEKVSAGGRIENVSLPEKSLHEIEKFR